MTSFAGAIERQPLRAFQLATVALVMTALVVDGLDYQLLALTAPLIIGELGVTRAAFGPAMAAALFGMAFGAAGGGWIGDRIGRLLTLVFAVGVFGAATTMAAQTHDVAMLAAWRVLGGIGFGAAGPNAMALASEWMPLRSRTYVVALLAIGTPAGGMIGAAALPAVLPALGWRGVFVLLGATAVVLGAVLLLVLRESPPWLSGKGRGAAARRAAMRIVTGEVSFPSAQRGETTPEVRLFAAGYWRLNVGLGLSFAALIAITYGLGSWMPEFLTAAGFTLEKALSASFALNACSILGALAAGWLARALGSRRTMLASALATCVLLAAFGLTLESAPGAQGVIIALAAGVGFAASVGVTTLYAMAALLYPSEIRSSGIGLGMTAGRIGGIVMVFYGGYLLDFAGGSASVLFGVLALAAILATTAGWLVRGHIPARQANSIDSRE